MVTLLFWHILGWAFASYFTVRAIVDLFSYAEVDFIPFMLAGLGWAMALGIK